MKLTIASQLGGLEGLARYPRWVCYDSQKAPVDPKTGRNASSNAPSTWGTIYEANDPAPRQLERDGSPRPPVQGLGLVLGSATGVGGPTPRGLDLDSCVDSKTGHVEKWALEIIRRFPGYWEYSPSGTGLHHIFFCPDAELPEALSGIAKRKWKRGGGKHPPAIELFLERVYFTVTGRAFPEVPDEVAELLGWAEPQQLHTADLMRIIDRIGPEFEADSPDDAKASNDPVDSLCEDGGDFGTHHHNSKPDWVSDDVLREMLIAIPNDTDVDYDYWMKVGMALCHHTDGSSDGLDLFDEWSSRNDKHQPGWTEKSWGWFKKDTAKASDSGRRLITARFLIAEAQKRGWTPPWKNPHTAGGDVENGRAFASRYRDEFKNCHASGEWLRWTGVRWESCTRGEEVEAAKALAADMLERATSEYTKAATDKAKALHKAALDLFKNRARLANMLEMAKTEPDIVVSPDAFDVDPMLLGVQNGVLDLRTGNLIAPDPAQRISRQAGPEFNPEATCPRWLRFLADVQPDPAVREFLQRAVGYTLTGLVDEEKWLFAHGVGANGKSVFANVLNALLGEYAITVSATLLAKNRNEGEAGRLVARLPGARLALANETRQGDVWDDQRMKELISRERISARKLYSEGFDFFPTHKLWVRGNHLPGVQDASDAFWRRMLPIAFSRQFEEAQRVPDLDRQIIAGELSGILNWAVDGCLEWQRAGLKVPPSVREEAARYREETDVVGLWREDRCHPDLGAKVTVAAAYRSYMEFCREQGVSALSQPAFTRLMTAKGIDRCKGTGGKRMFVGFSLIESDGGEFPEDGASDLI